jgi:mutator family transposase
MTATLDNVTKKSKREPAAEERRRRRWCARPGRGLALTGPEGLLKQLTRTVLETALSQEMTEHLGHEKHGPVTSKTGNVRNGTRPKTVLTEGSGPRACRYVPCRPLATIAADVTGSAVFASRRLKIRPHPLRHPLARAPSAATSSCCRSWHHARTRFPPR